MPLTGRQLHHPLPAPRSSKARPARAHHDLRLWIEAGQGQAVEVVEVEVADQDEVHCLVQGAVKCRSNAREEAKPIHQDGIGQDPDPVHLDQDRGMAQEGHGWKAHRGQAFSWDRVKITNGRSGPRTTGSSRPRRIRVAPVTRSVNR